MVLLYLTVVTSAVVLLSFRSHRSHPFERLMLGVLTSGLLGVSYDMFGVNARYVMVAHAPGAFLSFLLLGVILFPALLVQLADVLAASGSPVRCLLLLLAASAVLCALEYAADQLGILRHRFMNPFAVFVFWLLFASTVLMMRLFIAKMARRR